MTTMYVPMPEWQAILFLKDRKSAFARLVNAQADVLPEVVPANDGMFYAFCDREDAVRIGHQAYSNGFAMTRLVVHNFMHGSMFLKRQLVRCSDKDVGVTMYQINHDGLEHLLQKCESHQLEVMVDEIFGPKLAQPQPVAS